MDTITSTTCAYGLARTRDGCVRTLASFTPSNYKQLQLLNIGLGLVALGIATYKYARSVRNNGAKLQQRAFLLSMYSAMTFVVRGVDPMSYGHYIPRPIAHLIVDSCTAAIYTVFILTLEFWVSIIHKNQPTPQRKGSRVKLLAYSVIVIIWLGKVAVNLSMFWSKGFDDGYGVIELFATAGLLIVLCIVFAVYGIRVIHRLEAIDKMNARRISLASHFDVLNTSRIDHLATSHTSTVLSYTDCESNPNDSVLPPPPPPPTLPADKSATILPRPPKPVKQRKPAQKIKEMLIITEAIALLCIVAQIYTGCQRRNGYKELRCANGVECNLISAHWSLLHAFQYVTIYCVLFTFRKTTHNRNNANATTVGLAPPAHVV